MPPGEQLQINVPPFFRCPISLELMKDPVTLCTGLTYDRQSIEKWLEEGNSTCPGSMQHLPTKDLLPNHTLRRLIHTWCVGNHDEEIATPSCLPADVHRVRALLCEIDRHKHTEISIRALKQLRNIAKECENNRQIVREARGISILCEILCCIGRSAGEKTSYEMVDACEEAIATLSLLLERLDINSTPKEEITATSTSVSLISSIVCVLRCGSVEGKANAAHLLHTLAETEHPLALIMAETDDLIPALITLIRTRAESSKRAVKASLMAVLAIAAPRKNRLRIVEAGAVPVLIELLPEATLRNTETILAILETLCNSAEGRAAVVRHALAIPVLVAILRAVSDLATDHVVAILWCICQTAPEKSIMQAAVYEGAFTQLLFVIQADSIASTKQKSADLLKRLHHIWRDDPCSPDNAGGLITHNHLLI